LLTEKVIRGTPSIAPAPKITVGWFWNGIDRKRANIQPRLKPHTTSHQRQPSMQPTTLTGVPAGSQATNGNSRSGPARMLAGSVVKAANCADALSGDRIAAAISHGRSQRIARSIGFLMKSSDGPSPNHNPRQPARNC